MIDPNVQPLGAPPGFVAHKDTGERCGRCCAEDDDALCEKLPCLPSQRADGLWVYFTKAEAAS